MNSAFDARGSCSMLSIMGYCRRSFKRLLELGLGRFIDISMHRHTECTDTRIVTLGAVSRYFPKNRTANFIYAEPQNKSYYF